MINIPFVFCRDFDSLNEEDNAANLQLAFDTSERELGIHPFTSGKELCADQELDKTKMVTYLSKFYELFRGTPLPLSGIKTLLHSILKTITNHHQCLLHFSFGFCC